MPEAIKHCMICGRSITPQFCVCAECERKYGLDRPKRVWPDWAKWLERDWQRQRDYERRQLEWRDPTNYDIDTPKILDSAAAAFRYDVLAFGEPNTDITDNIQSEYIEQGADSAGKLRCLDCGRVFYDVWPTFPLPPTRWQIPRCPYCGGGWYEDVR